MLRSFCIIIVCFFFFSRIVESKEIFQSDKYSSMLINGEYNDAFLYALNVIYENDKYLYSKLIALDDSIDVIEEYLNNGKSDCIRALSYKLIADFYQNKNNRKSLFYIQKSIDLFKLIYGFNHDIVIAVIVNKSIYLEKFEMFNEAIDCYLEIINNLSDFFKLNEDYVNEILLNLYRCNYIIGNNDLSLYYLNKLGGFVDDYNDYIFVLLEKCRVYLSKKEGVLFSETHDKIIELMDLNIIEDQNKYIVLYTLLYLYSENNDYHHMIEDIFFKVKKKCNEIYGENSFEMAELLFDFSLLIISNNIPNINVNEILNRTVDILKFLPDDEYKKNIII